MVAYYLENYTPYKMKDIDNSEETIKKINYEIQVLKSRIPSSNDVEIAQILDQINKKNDDIKMIQQFVSYKDNCFNEDKLKANLAILANPKIKKEVKKDIIEGYHIEENMNAIKESIINDMIENEKAQKKYQEKEKGGIGMENKNKNKNNGKNNIGKGIAIGAGSTVLSLIMLWSLCSCAKRGLVAPTCAPLPQFTGENLDEDHYYNQFGYDNYAEPTYEPERITPEVNQPTYVEPEVTEPIVSNAEEQTTPSYTEEDRLVDVLFDKGYDWNVAEYLVNNLSTDEIYELAAAPWYLYNPDNANDYFAAKNRYNLTFDKAIDFVNRAYSIQRTGFYRDATIYDIIEVLISIDNKDLMRIDNANLAQSFNTSFNGITNNYLFGETTNEDLYKLDAIQYFGSEYSDLGDFLAYYGPLVQRVVVNPYDEGIRDELVSYVRLFATSLNGFINEPSALTDNELFNNSAVVNDYLDWYIAYESFIKPLFPVLYPKDIEDIDFTNIEQIAHITILDSEGRYLEDQTRQARIAEIERRGLGKYTESILKAIDLVELNDLMETALRDPQIQEAINCGRTKGGN
jgi:hypothetical protein